VRNRAAVRVVGPLHWIGYPALACVAAALVFATPVRFFGFPPPEPVFPLILAFAWPLIRPSIGGPVVLFLCGLFLDLLWGGPLGLWALALLGVYAGVLAGRSLIIGQENRVLFAWYVGATASAFLFAYLVVQLDAKEAPSLIGVGLQMLATVLLFPLTQALIMRFEDGDVRFR
jgi:rod shape-determining protein MreD